MALYSDGDYDGINYDNERTSDLVAEPEGAAKYRIEVAHDFFDGPPDYYDSGYPDTGYADTGYAETDKAILAWDLVCCRSARCVSSGPR